MCHCCPSDDDPEVREAGLWGARVDPNHPGVVFDERMRSPEFAKEVWEKAQKEAEEILRPFRVQPFRRYTGEKF